MKNVALKAFRPEGWLREQIRLNAEGFFDHLTDISDCLTDGNGWLQWWKTAEDFAAETGKSAAEYQLFAWEEQAYWLRGAYRLALLGDDPTLMAQCEPYFEAVIASRREDGYFGPESLRNIETNGMPVPDLSRETGRGGTAAHLRAPGLHARPHELFSVVPKTVTISYLYTETER